VNKREAQIYIKKHKETEKIYTESEGVVSKLGGLYPPLGGGCKNITAAHKKYSLRG